VLSCEARPPTPHSAVKTMPQDREGSLTHVNFWQFAAFKFVQWLGAHEASFRTGQK